MKAVHRAQDLIDMITGDDTYTPTETAPQTHPAPGTDPGNGRGGDCRRGGKGWVDLYDTDPGNGNRAQGVKACLTQQYLDKHKGTPTTRYVRPPGYAWAQRYARHVGAVPTKEFVNNCHLLGSQISGSGTDLRNLATCGRDANTYPERGGLGAMDNMVQFENQALGRVQAHHTVEYTVIPRYSGRRTVPEGFDMSMTSWDATGNYAGSVSRYVQNLMNTPSGWKNLGTVVDSRTGLDVPTR